MALTTNEMKKTIHRFVKGLRQCGMWVKTNGVREITSFNGTAISCTLETNATNRNDYRIFLRDAGFKDGRLWFTKRVGNSEIRVLPWYGKQGCKQVRVDVFTNLNP